MSEINEVKNGELTEEDIKAFEDAMESDDKKEVKEEVKEEVAEEKPEESTEEEDVAEPSTAEEPQKEEIKEVVGETPKERALRLELTRVRREKRALLEKNIFKKQEPEEDKTFDELKSLGYRDEDIPGLEKAVDIIASKRGYVKKDSFEKEMSLDTLNNFVEEHPEYAPENDKDEILFNRFFEILKSDYNLDGKNSKQLKSIFQKVDRDVKSEYGEPKMVADKGKIEAQKQKIKTVSHGTSASAPKQIEKPVIPAGNKTFISSNHPGLVFKGFEDDEIEDILK